MDLGGVFCSLRGSQGNTEGLNSSCVGANCMDAREHGAPAAQTACSHVTQRRSACRESIQTSPSPSGRENALPASLQNLL